MGIYSNTMFKAETFFLRQGPVSDFQKEPPIPSCSHLRQRGSHCLLCLEFPGWFIPCCSPITLNMLLLLLGHVLSSRLCYLAHSHVSARPSCHLFLGLLPKCVLHVHFPLTQQQTLLPTFGERPALWGRACLLL